MDCQRTLESLSPLVDGELQLNLSGPVLSHLHECAACRAEADALRSLSLIVREVTGIAPAGLRAGLLREARILQENRRSSLSGIISMWPRAAAMLVGAASVALCFSLATSTSVPRSSVERRSSFGLLVSESEARLELVGSFLGDSLALATTPAGRLISDLTGGR